MRKTYTPTPEQRERAPGARLLWLSGERPWRRDGEASASVVVFGAARASGWLARIDGVTERWSVIRVFLEPDRIASLDGVGRRLEFHELVPGLYEAEGIIDEGDGAEVMRVCFQLSEGGGFELLGREGFEQALRVQIGASFGDVRSLVAVGDFVMAELAASWLELDSARRSALEYVADARVRHEVALPELIGAPASVQQASVVRRKVLRALALFEARSEALDPAAIGAARGWFLAHTSADFWAEYSQRCDDGEAIWRGYLMATADFLDT